MVHSDGVRVTEAVNKRSTSLQFTGGVTRHDDSLCSFFYLQFHMNFVTFSVQEPDLVFLFSMRLLSNAVHNCRTECTLTPDMQRADTVEKKHDHSHASISVGLYLGTVMI